MLSQQRLAPKNRKPIARTTYGGPQYVAVRGNIQRIELHRGCPWAKAHDFCYEPFEHKDFPIPELAKNQVQILDMNFLARKDALKIIKELGTKRVDGRVIYYELICGIDYELICGIDSFREAPPSLGWTP